jgi:hypothetical protein
MEKPKSDEKLEEVIEDPLGDNDIRHYLPNAKIMKYSELRHYPTIDDLLPNDIDYVVLLYEDSPNKGHWVCVCKYRPYIEFFDSYGGSPDSQLGWVPCPIRKQLNQSKPYLTDLFNKCKNPVIYNPIKYQDDEDDVNTCGRHCVFRIKNLIDKRKTLGEYYLLMKELKDKTKMNYDEIVAEIIDRT